MRKHNKLSPAAFKSVKEMATTATGYTDKSPIWGKRLPEVLDAIETEVNAGNEVDAVLLIQELKKRLAKNAVIAQARHG